MLQKLIGESVLKSIIAWGSISYAFGFLVITIHTFRLGIPVIELFQPLYIWVGLPLALVGFFSKWLLDFFRQRVSTHSAEIQRSITGLRDDVGQNEVDQISEAFAALISFALLGSTRWADSATKWFAARFRIKFDELLVDSDADQVAVEKALRRLARAARLAQGTTAFFGFINVISTAFLIPVLLVIYVWWLYPEVPQSLGGGSPTRVQLLLDSNKTGTTIPGISLLPTDAEGTKPSPAAMTEELLLLYATEKTFFVRRERGPVVSVSAPVVLATIWVDTDDRLNADKSAVPTSPVATDGTKR